MQLVKIFHLIEDLLCQLCDCRPVLFIEKELLAQTSRRLDDLLAIEQFFLIDDQRHQFAQDAILQSNSRNDDFVDARLLHDFLQDNSSRNNDVCPVWTKTQLLNPLFKGGGSKFLNQSLEFFRGHFLVAVLVEKFLTQFANRFDASSCAHTNIDFLIPDLLFESSLRRVDIFGNQLIESFFTRFFVENFQ